MAQIGLEIIYLGERWLFASTLCCITYVTYFFQS